MIEESYVSFDTARMLKEAGFDMPCRYFFTIEGDGNVVITEARSCREHNSFESCFISCPTLALAARWLREVHGIHVMIHPYYDCSVNANGEIVDKRMYWGYMILYAETGNLAEDNDERFDNYEQALEAGLRGVVKLIKK